MLRKFLLTVLLGAQMACASAQMIAVSDFAGKPPEIGQEIAETLITDLAKSERLNLVERAQLWQALRELRLQTTGLTEPAQAKRVGKLIGAEALVVGSFYLRDGQIVINARVVDVRTGQVMKGKAENVQGKLTELYSLLGTLANRLHLRLTGVQLASAEPSNPPAESEPIEILDADGDEDIIYVVQQGWMRCTPEGYFYPDKPVTAGDFYRVLLRFASARKWEGKMEFDNSRPGDLMNTLRPVVTLTRLALPPERFSEQPPVEGALALIPGWARPYVYEALQQGYIRDISEASPHQVLTRRQLAKLLTRMVPLPPTFKLPADKWTGLVVDTTGLGMRSSMCPRIVDEKNRLVYLEPKYAPPWDYAQQYGIADFVKREDQTKRAGDKPVYVKALRVKGPAKDEVVISVEDAERVLDAAKESRFLRLWRVVFLVD
ncbi:MAG: hypothetical protein HPY54_09615 [Chthonomonadetes bacterium]|nr:hypothetical protein [Chthonomonadetes bacterium]